jgi:hypothetical protein
MTQGCPSELDLDRYDQGEMSGSESARIAAHTKSCASCVARLEQRKAGFAAFVEVDPARMVAQLHERLGGKDIPEAAVRRAHEIMGVEAPLSRTFWERLWEGMLRPSVVAPVAIGFIIACAVTYYFALARPRGDDRLKGSMALEVHKMGAEEPVHDGDRLRPKDRVRFEVSLPLPGEIMIVGEESAGTLFAYHPSGVVVRSRPSVRSHEVIEGAWELDESMGPEWIHLVWCPTSFGLEDVKRGTAPGRPILAPGCRRTSVSIVKE